MIGRVFVLCLAATFAQADQPAPATPGPIYYKPLPAVPSPPSYGLPSLPAPVFEPLPPAPVFEPSPSSYALPSAPAPVFKPLPPPPAAPVYKSYAPSTPATPAPIPPYAFNYAVADAESGVDISADEQAEGGAVAGSYRVALPDGRIKTVSYTVQGDSGFVADVAFEAASAPAPAPYPKYVPYSA